MQQTLHEYKCPCCGGAIIYDSVSRNMKCPYCDTEFEVETLQSYASELSEDTADEMQWENPPAASWVGGEADGIRTFVCNSCGGEIVGDENTAASACPFCGNPVVLSGNLSGTLKPDLIIPFRLDKKAAKAALAAHLKRKVLLPKIFKDENHIDEIKGIYVPFWLFDTKADARIRYRATRVRTWSDAKFDYTETSHYLLHRAGSLAFANIPVDGSSKIANDLMESIEPFDTSDATDFHTAYLAGFLADKYDVNAEQSVARANERVKVSTEQAFAETVHGYTTVHPEHSSVHLSDGSVKYALYPVWLLSTTWKGKHYLFAMNGQTGKFVGDLPVDAAAARKWTLILTAAFSALTYGIVALIHALGIA